MRVFFRVIALVLCIAVILPVCAYAQDDESQLELITPPTRTDFYEGRDWGYVQGKIYPYSNFDLSGAVIRCEGIDVPYFVFPWGANIWCEPVSGKWKTGANDVYIYSDDFDGVYTTSSINLYGISSLSVAEKPSFTDYIRGIDWNYNESGKITVNEIRLAGLSLNILYADGTRDSVTYNKKKENITWTVPSDTFEYTVGQNELYAVYCSKHTRFSFNLLMESMTGAYIKTAPEKTSYAFGTDWRYKRGTVSPDIDLTGLAVTATYNNGDTRDFFYDEEPERFAVESGVTYDKGESYVALRFDSEYQMTYPVWIESAGDVNFDGLVNSTDALCVMKYIVGTMEFDEYAIGYADVNDDGIITSADALDILRNSAGLISLFESEI